MFTKNGNKYFISSHGEHDTYLTKLKWNSKGKGKGNLKPRKPSLLGASYSL